jgi:hypothetical protein
LIDWLNVLIALLNINREAPHTIKVAIYLLCATPLNEELSILLMVGLRLFLDSAGEAITRKLAKSPFEKWISAAAALGLQLTCSPCISPFCRRFEAPRLPFYILSLFFYI